MKAKALFSSRNPFPATTSLSSLWTWSTFYTSCVESYLFLYTLMLVKVITPFFFLKRYIYLEEVEVEESGEKILDEGIGGSRSLKEL